MVWEIDEGDEVTLSATITKLIDGVAAVSIPSFNYPLSIEAPARAKKGTVVSLTAEVTRVDDETITVRLPDGRRITLRADVVARRRERKRAQFTGRDRPDWFYSMSGTFAVLE